MAGKVSLGRVAIAASLVAAIVVACYGATESMVAIATDVDCATARANGIEIRTAATNAELRNALSVATSNVCNPAGSINDLGTIVLVPSNDAKSVVVQVTLGVRHTARECSADPTLKGCIVARRQVSYVTHQSLRIPIFLAQSCADTQCPENQTCVKGQCVASDVSTVCVDGVCALDDARAPGPSSSSSSGAVGGDADLSDGSSGGSSGSSGSSSGGDGGDASTCPPRPTTLPPNCAACPTTSMTQECCAKANGFLGCLPKGQCVMEGVLVEEAQCTADCQCAPGTSCAVNLVEGCPGIKICGSCYAAI